MHMFVGRRIHSGSTVAAAMLPVAVVVVALITGCFLTNRLSAVVALSIGGLILDMLGAMTLAGGLILSRSTSIRVQLRNHPEDENPLLLGPTTWQWLCARGPFALAVKLGSTDADEISPTSVQEMVDATWGWVLLMLGFLAQALGAGLQTLR